MSLVFNMKSKYLYLLFKLTKLGISFHIFSYLLIIHKSFQFSYKRDYILRYLNNIFIIFYEGTLNTRTHYTTRDFFYVGCKPLGTQYFRKIDQPTYIKHTEPKPLKTILFGKNLLI